jgi:hypothetical protein
MRPRRWVTFILGVVLSILGLLSVVSHGSLVGLIPLLFGLSLVWLGWRGDRTSLLVFGHTSVVIGAAMIAWGIYLLPYSKPTFLHIIGRPLFWGLIALLGGICSIYHGFCRCIRVPKQDS